MEVYRILKEGFANNLTASGKANRWNKRGQLVIYAGSSRSLSTLELIVHRSNILPAIPYKVAVISFNENQLIKQVEVNKLPTNWRTFSAYPALQELGSRWYTGQESLVLKIPSAVIPQEYNYMINTEHPDFSHNIQLLRIEDYFWDERLM